MNLENLLMGTFLNYLSYSGSDLSNMSNDALMAPVRNLNKTKTWVEVMDQGKVKYAPHDENVPRDPNLKYFEGSVD